MEQNWGLVFSGGGAKGAYQIGVWKAMRQLHMEQWMDKISGSSIGSLNAALFASGDYIMAETAWSEVDLLSVFDTDWALLDGKEGTLSRDAMLTLIRRYVQYPRLAVSPYAVVCSVSRILSPNQYRSSIQGLLGEQVYAGEYMRLDGRTPYDIENILLASSSMPIIHEAVEINGYFYRDGGLTDNCPMRPLYDMGCRKMIVVGLKAEMERFQADFPDVEFLSVYPSHPLGNFFQGTMNFRPKYIRLCQKLGYKDGMRIFQAYISGNQNPLRMQELAERDYQEILMEFRQENLQGSVDEHMSTLQRIIDRYSD